ncbi:MAG: hypothetical protein U0M06_01940 [Clostridia bacterium]|nr:hypothetical protein [Clostridia bacterium]
MAPKTDSNKSLTLRETAVFPILGVLMYLGDILMEWLPNVHFVGVLCVVYTLVYRKKALIPLYIYVLLNGFFAGFSIWWIPYLYIWLPLWALAMLIRKNHRVEICILLSSGITMLHGFAFGILYAPAQAIMFGLDAKATLAWIAAGLPWDIIHGLGNLAASVIIIPIVTVLCRLENIPLPYKIIRKRG